MNRTRFLLTAAVVCLPSTGLAQAFTFDGVPPTDGGTNLGSSFVQTLGLQTLTVTTVPGGVLHMHQVGVPLLGFTSIIATDGPFGPGFVPMRFSFSNPIGFITFAFGDQGFDSDDPARIEAFDAFGNLLGVFDTPYTGFQENGATRTLNFVSVGASYFILSSGSSVVDSPINPNSLYWEVAASTPFTATPEPASVTLVAVGLLCFGSAYRRRAVR